jgi:hypothetical protein
MLMNLFMKTPNWLTGVAALKPLSAVMPRGGNRWLFLSVRLHP